ncbi:MAG: DNA primase [Planctomycetota bacterium]|nr:DNA primase [Planctomycetota bacterium]
MDADVELFLVSFSANTNSDRDRVLEAADLVALVGEVVALRLRGREHVGLCPFHDDHSPSMSVVTHKGNAFYKCFSCNAGGNAIDFMINHYRMTFPEALESLAKRFGVVLSGDGRRGTGSSQPLRRALRIGLDWYRRGLRDENDGRVAREAIAARHISPAMVEMFLIGASSPRRDRFVQYMHKCIQSETDAGNPISVEAFREAGLIVDGQDGLRDAYPGRLIFPILNESGEPIAFGARRLKEAEQPKYINSPESAVFHKSKSLYGIHAARQSIIETKVAIVTEGYTDVIACHQAGVRNVIATLGTSLTREHARALSRLATRVILLFDGDAAGQRAADRATEVFFREPVDILVAALPDEMDPDELLCRPDGVLRFEQVLRSARPAMDLVIDSFKGRIQGASGPSERQRAIVEMLARLASMGLNEADPIRRSLILDEVSRTCGVQRADLVAALPSQRVTPNATDGNKPFDRRTVVVEAASAVPTKARIVAEEDFIAALLGAPEESIGSFSSPDGDSATLGELLSPTTFVSPSCAMIFERAIGRIDAGSAPFAQHLLGEGDETAFRETLFRLTELGSRRSGDFKVAREPIVLALRTLLLSIQTPSDRGRSLLPLTNPKEAQLRLDQIRSRGPNVLAVSVSARTSLPTQRHD